MTDKQAARLYRIGDYARYMGVSPDLLKYYEKLGLIQSETRENGYHYYAFQQSMPLLECMRLRNYGFSLREIGALMKDLPFEDVQALLDSQVNDLEKRLQFEQLVVQEHRRISAWMDMMRASDIIVQEKQMEPLLFLPQSHQRDFIHDERISQLLGTWVNAMPLVKSCRLVPDMLAPDAVQGASWGLAVTESSARLLGLPMNDVVRQVPGGRYLHIHYRRAASKYGSVAQHFTDIRAILREQGVQPAGPSVQIALMTVNRDNDREICGWFAVPTRQIDG